MMSRCETVVPNATHEVALAVQEDVVLIVDEKSNQITRCHHGLIMAEALKQTIHTVVKPGATIEVPALI